MKCTRPITINPKPSKGRLYNPYNNIMPIQVPCGHCIACRLNYQSEWAGRIAMEALYSQAACFIRLSYNEDSAHHVEELTSLNKKEIQKFLKKVRKEKNFRYYLAGEYGGKTFRAHYHILFFFKNKTNIYTFYDLVKEKWAEETISKGTCDLKPYAARHAMYITKYLVKRFLGYWKTLFTQQTGLEPEFSLLSTKPFLGNVPDDKLKQIIFDGFVYSHNKKYKIHKIYLDKLREKFPELHKQFLYGRNLLEIEKSISEKQEERRSNKIKVLNYIAKNLKFKGEI